MSEDTLEKSKILSDKLASLDAESIAVLLEECRKRKRDAIYKKINDLFVFAAQSGLTLDQLTELANKKKSQMAGSLLLPFFLDCGYAFPTGELSRASLVAADGYTSISDLYNEYLAHCVGNRTPPLRRREFRRVLLAMGIKIWKRSNIVVDLVKIARSTTEHQREGRRVDVQQT